MLKKKKKAKAESKFNPQYIKLGKRIRGLRQERGYTSALKFAFDKGLSSVQMQRWEQGNNMSFESMIRLAEAFDITVEELLEGF